MRYDCDVAPFVALTGAHLSDMLELTTLVYPAYFRPRTPAQVRRPVADAIEPQ